VKILLVGDTGDATALADELVGEGVDVERRADEPGPASGADEIGALARELREFERALGDGGPDLVLVASASSAALAAVLVATKVGTPVAAIERAGGEPGTVNARLIRQLSDARLAPEAAAISGWLRGTYTERP
jgi:UDP-N-acetylglucosamine 2-epimerase